MAHVCTRSRCGDWPLWWRALAVLLGAMGWQPGASAQASCNPSSMCCLVSETGSPCGGAGVATLGNVSGVDSGAGNPINVLGGNKFQREVDMPALPGVLGLELVRHYNSADTRRGPLGRGWRLSYETELRVRPTGLEIAQADGTLLFFRPGQANSDVHRASDPLQGLVRRMPTARGTEYLWLWADGRELRFNTRGQLEQIRVPSGEFLSLRYGDRGRLLEVIDPAGRRLGLNHLDKASARSGERYRGVQSVDTPVGRYHYEYGGALPAGSRAPASELIANLVRVRYPAVAPAGSGGPGAALGREYHHEDPRFPTLLTGISAQGGAGGAPGHSERLSTWAYDAQRRAVLSVQGERPASGAGPREVGLQWRAGPKGQVEALLRNSLGQITVYTTASVAGAPRILQVRGPGCADCGPSNVRYGYDALGRLTEETTLNEQGQAVLTRRTERDAYGRPVRISDTVHRQGRPHPAQWRVRYAYAPVGVGDALAVPDPQPVLIARPSVVAGRERITRLGYNAARQLVSVSEEGFSPVDEQGRPDEQGAPLRRVTQHGYAPINGRSLRVSTDGPMPNGGLNSPADSDVTLYEWDARGDQLRRVTRPGALVTLFQQEVGTGRLIGITDPAGVVTELSEHLAPLGRPRAIRSGSRLSQLQFDLRGRLSRVQVGEAVSWQASGEAVAEEHGLGLGRRDDPWERPVAWYAPGGGGPVLQADWGPRGSAAERSVLRWDVDGAYAQRELDDFGRVVAIRERGQGWRYAVHDAAGRIVATTDARGAHQRVQRDAAGRVLRIEHRAPGEDRAQQVVQRRYEGERLIEERVRDADGTRHTHYAYDARGALASETLKIEPEGELALAMTRPLSLSIAYRYGAGGELLARQITDATGRTLSVQQALDEQGQVARIGTRGVLPRWLGGGREIVRGIQWQVLASLQYATRIAHGDGSVDTFERLPEGAGATMGVAGPVGAALPAAAAPAVVRAQTMPRRPRPGQDRDAAGLPAFLRTSEGLQGLRWNPAGQLAQTQREGGRSRYIYDARGRRVVTLSFGARGEPSLRLALYEEHRLLAEADANGRLTHGYVHLGHRPVAQLVLQRGWAWPALQAWLWGPRVRHLHTARAGRVLSMSEGGREVWQDGDAPAQRAQGAAPVHQPLRYVGQYHDAESGLDYHGARFFEAGAGSFISPDPAGVADAIDGLAPSRLLDLYAYAGGRPDEYFDPDGAARMRYFAITTNAQGKAMGSTQGFVKARWAFIVDNVRAGGDSSALGQKRNQYASTGTSVLVDVAGNFLDKGMSSEAWSGPEAATEQAFLKHYGDKLISIEQFTIGDMDDDDAAALIASYIEADMKQVFGGVCPARAPLLPPIRFADEELPIDVTQAAYRNPSDSGQTWAGSQRIVQCGEKAKTDVVERRIQKYNFGFMLLESNPPQIYMDCSKDGCPGRSLRGTVLSDYVASYGQTQFIGTTIVDKLLALRAGTVATPEERKALRLDETRLWSAVEAAFKRAKFVVNEFPKRARDRLAWSEADEPSRIAFMSGSGLDERAAEVMWNDIRRWFEQPVPNLGGEARAAFGTAVLMSDPVVRDFLMNIFRDSRPGGAFAHVALAFARSNYVQVEKRVDQSNTLPRTLPDGSVNRQWTERQRQIEIELAARVARMHNGDIGEFALKRSLTDLMVRDNSGQGRQYARRFLNAPEFAVVQPADSRRQQPVADYFSLRCASELPSAVGKLGIQLTPLSPR